MGTTGDKPEGKITENLGSMNAPGTDILAIVKSFNIPSEFPVKVNESGHAGTGSCAGGRPGWQNGSDTAS